jgi:hypothetical protein
MSFSDVEKKIKAAELVLAIFDRQHELSRFDFFSTLRKTFGGGEHFSSDGV